MNTAKGLKRFIALLEKHINKLQKHNYRKVFLVEEADRWLEKAQKDWSDAEVNFKHGLYEVCAFLSHQAAEKALKALYILRFKRLWKIHDLKKLAEKVDADRKTVDLGSKLNPHYLATRYPLDVEFTEDIAKTALDNSKEVLEWAQKKSKKMRN